MVLSHQLCPHHRLPVGHGGHDPAPLPAPRHHALQQGRVLRKPPPPPPLLQPSLYPSLIPSLPPSFSFCFPVLPSLPSLPPLLSPFPLLPPSLSGGHPGGLWLEAGAWRCVPPSHGCDAALRVRGQRGTDSGHDLVCSRCVLVGGSSMMGWLTSSLSNECVHWYVSGSHNIPLSSFLSSLLPSLPLSH